MLDSQMLVDLLLKFAVRMNFVRHANWLGKGSDQEGVRFNSPAYRLLSPCRYRAGVGFLIATREVIRNPPFEVEFRRHRCSETVERMFRAFDLTDSQLVV
jgi:hypothetical protein